jgi:Zn-finger nucleic acid-binding protein
MNATASTTSGIMTTACPRCGHELFTAPADGGALLGCGTCGGVWLDSAACQALMDGSSRELVELAERAARHATAPADTSTCALCPACRSPLVRGEVPGTAVAINTCAAHGTWFDRDGVRLVALRFAHLPPPLQFHKEDYQLPAPEPETLGDLVLLQAFGPPAQAGNDAIPDVSGAPAGGTFWTDKVLAILLAVAVAGTMVSLAMHAASLLGYTVTNGPLHLIVFLAIFPPFGLGIWANYQMGNAVRDADGGIAMGDRHFRRELGLIEWIVLVVVELYASVMAWYLWPVEKSDILVPGSDLTVADARAVWACDLLFFVAALGIVVVARRLARRRT